MDVIKNVNLDIIEENAVNAKKILNVALNIVKVQVIMKKKKKKNKVTANVTAYRNSSAAERNIVEDIKNATKKAIKSIIVKIFIFKDNNKNLWYKVKLNMLVIHQQVMFI